MLNQSQSTTQTEKNESPMKRLSDIIIELCDPDRQPHSYVGEPEKLTLDITNLIKEDVTERRRRGKH